MTKIEAGQQYGRWTTIEKTASTPRGSVWLCRCQCGSTKEMLGYRLTTGESKSCGCLRTNSVARPGKKVIAGYKSEMLTAIREVAEDTWLCKCDCGNTKTVLAKYLTRGNPKSCGCLRKIVAIGRKPPTQKPQQPKKFCKAGHEMTPDNTYIYTTGSRYCRTCEKLRASEKRSAAKG